MKKKTYKQGYEEGYRDGARNLMLQIIVQEQKESIAAIDKLLEKLDHIK